MKGLGRDAVQPSTFCVRLESTAPGRCVAERRESGKMPKSRALAVATACVALVLPILVGVIILRTAVDVPYWDEWEWTTLIYRAHIGALQLGDIWAQHSEHRLFFPQLIVLALDKFGGWSQVREQLISLFFIVFGEIALLSIINRTIHGPTGRVVTVLGCMFLFGLWQYENLSWGFQTAWFICNTCAIVVAGLLARTNRSATTMFMAVVLSLIASYSSSQGLVVWAVGAVAILLTPRSIVSTFLIWLSAGALTYTVFQINAVHPNDGRLSLIHHPLDGIRYILAYLGSPMEGIQGPGKSEVVGVILLLIVIFSFLADLWRRDRLLHLVRRAPWYALAVYPIFCAAITAYGRGKFGVHQALTSRYTTISGLLWISAIAIVGSYVARLPASTWRVRFAAASFATLLVFVGRAEYMGWLAWSALDQKLVAARAGLIRSDPSVLSTLYPDPGRERLLLNELKQIHDGIFAE